MIHYYQSNYQLLHLLFGSFLFTNVLIKLSKPTCLRIIANILEIYICILMEFYLIRKENSLTMTYHQAKFSNCWITDQNIDKPHYVFLWLLFYEYKLKGRITSSCWRKWMFLWNMIRTSKAITIYFHVNWKSDMKLEIWVTKNWWI